jgi:hypothetical protein
MVVLVVEGATLTPCHLIFLATFFSRVRPKALNLNLTTTALSLELRANFDQEMLSCFYLD